MTTIAFPTVDARGQKKTIYWGVSWVLSCSSAGGPQTDVTLGKVQHTSSASVLETALCGPLTAWVLRETTGCSVIVKGQTQEVCLYLQSVHNHLLSFCSVGPVGSIIEEQMIESEPLVNHPRDLWGECRNQGVGAVVP